MTDFEGSKLTEERADHGLAPAPVDPDEVAKFRGIAERWWDPDGPMQPLHRLNPCRLGWIRATACRHFGLKPQDLHPLQGLRTADVGCGGGLLTEPLARMGADVTGIDPTPENIATATWHAEEVGLGIDYRVGSADDLTQQGDRFSLVLALEVIEHTPDPAAFVESLAPLVSEGGLVILSTLSRTWRSWLFGVVGAEYVLGWLPRGTHQWDRFVRPRDLSAMLRLSGLRPVALTGLGYDPAQQAFRTVRDTSVNYMIAAAAD
jgi:2-polyprenyl-6-hydroxyphenyl methylase/3-demethylubiquinone-9 3-methyltransferase